MHSASLDFAQSLEELAGRGGGLSCYGLRSLLLAQAKHLLEVKQEQNLTNLAAALDSEKWTQVRALPPCLLFLTAAFFYLISPFCLFPLFDVPTLLVPPSHDPFGL